MIYWHYTTGQNWNLSSKTFGAREKLPTAAFQKLPRQS